MNEHVPAKLLTLPMPKGRRPFVLSDPDSRAAGSSRTSLDLRLGQCQVALVSKSIYGLADQNVPRDASMPDLVLLPLTWSDLFCYIRSQAKDLRTESHDHIAAFGDIWIDLLQHEARRADKPVELTALEFKIVRFFVSNPNRVISRAELLESVWGYRCFPTTRTVDNKILRLRRKLERKPANPIHFRTVHGAGYKFVP